MRLNGDKIYLREVRESDLTQAYVDWLNDPEVNRSLETRFQVQSMDSVKEYFFNHGNKADEPWWAIIITGEFHKLSAPHSIETAENFEKHIGNIKLGPVNSHHRRADISLFIGDKSQWGKGYGTEAIKLVTEYSFKTLNLNKVCAGIYSLNIGSKMAFTKAGFKVEAVLDDHVFTDEGYKPLLLMGRTSFDS